MNADDQGLGKTLQTIAFMAWLQNQMNLGPSHEKKPILVVAPTTLLKNWAAEVETHMHDMFGLGTRIDAYQMNAVARRAMLLTVPHRGTRIGTEK